MKNVNEHELVIGRRIFDKDCLADSKDSEVFADEKVVNYGESLDVSLRG